MAVTIKEGPTLLPGSSFTWSGGEYKASYDWLVVAEFPPASDWDLLPEVVFSAVAGSMPVEGSPHPFVPFAYCDSIKCAHEKAGKYIITVSYTTAHSDKTKGNGTNGQGNGKQEDPISDLPIIRPIAGIKSVPIYRDIEEKAILNAAGDPLIDEAERQVFGFTIKQNVQFLPAWVEDLIDSKSSTDIKIRNYLIQAGQARFILPSDYLSEPKRRNGIEYYEFTFEIRVDTRDDHDGKLLNAGFFELVPRVDEEGEPVLDDDDEPIIDRKAIVTKADGSEPTEPVPLDPETGRVLEDPQPDTVHYVTVKRYHAADYTNLPGVQPA